LLVVFISQKSIFLYDIQYAATFLTGHNPPNKRPPKLRRIFQPCKFFFPQAEILTLETDHVKKNCNPRVSYLVRRLFAACSPLVRRSTAAEKRRKTTGQNPAMWRPHPMVSDSLQIPFPYQAPQRRKKKPWSPAMVSWTPKWRSTSPHRGDGQ